eukprot:TRINITY_DN19028_c0_g1::TRINITY_DN19028_c0_g1_i1::g.21607::m.21607 TRINITY_DN19028_c0_g1::TRINITY_DN19028_c0_g1_i1::g.21607  ORF type:complete len:326 (-),score=21.98,sp/Q9ERC1/MYO16_RAT/36.97/7e-09,Ank_4/PF13637.1/4.9e+02,Ank_4/PF13637.1/0.00038,Ank_4/PF13637.1/1.4e-06,Ank_2/PF12796.2/2.1e-10,Ank_2/PF12796.2/5.6e+03,Ank/PF00023.25/0.018,Ank/PF00023.25/0.0002,Ank/PF00023.25/2.2e+03,Ank_5/PF13857.1/0.29,Ank_5/PF13857.1/3e-07,Ank_3/PF13606.1/7.4,Ank_3/PF13606.1/0.00037,Ank_3/PF13606.1/5.9e+02 TRINI
MQSPDVEKLVSLARSGDMGSIQRMLPTMRNVLDERASDGTIALVAATTWGHDDVALVLLKAGADVNGCNDGTLWTPLHVACMQERTRLVLKLLNEGADPLAMDLFNRTPVDYAALSDSVWPFFEARGFERLGKAEMIEKGLIVKVENADLGGTPPMNPSEQAPNRSTTPVSSNSISGRRHSDPGNSNNNVPSSSSSSQSGSSGRESATPSHVTSGGADANGFMSFSRPGSAYIRRNPLLPPPGVSFGRSQSFSMPSSKQQSSTISNTDALTDGDVLAGPPRSSYPIPMSSSSSSHSSLPPRGNASSMQGGSRTNQSAGRTLNSIF